MNFGQRTLAEYLLIENPRGAMVKASLWYSEISPLPLRAAWLLLFTPAISKRPDCLQLINLHFNINSNAHGNYTRRCACRCLSKPWCLTSDGNTTKRKGLWACNNAKQNLPQKKRCTVQTIPLVVENASTPSSGTQRFIFNDGFVVVSILPRYVNDTQTVWRLTNTALGTATRVLYSIFSLSCLALGVRHADIVHEPIGLLVHAIRVGGGALRQ